MVKKIKWLDWLRAYGHKKLSEELDVGLATVQSWDRGKNLPKDILKRQIVDLSGGLLDYNSFYEV